MRPKDRQRVGDAWLLGSAVALVAAAAFLLGKALTSPSQVQAAVDALPFFAVIVVLGLFALAAGWWQHRAGLRELLNEDGRSELEAKLAEREAELNERHSELEDQRGLIARLRQARDNERDWARELRSEVGRLNSQSGVLGDNLNDIRELVLRLSVSLVGSEKGLLLSREDEDSDGNLDLAATFGFENDPEKSALAQRFATEVLKQDTTVRDDNPSVAAGERAQPADREINNLVAIPIYIQDRFSGVVVCANRPEGFEEFDDEVLLALGDHAGAILQNGRLHHELRGSYVGTVSLLAETLAAKDPFLRGHSDEVSDYVAAVADKLGVDKGRREELVFASLLHDVGKIGVSERILLKPAALTPEERGLIELHPRIGYRLIQQVPALQPMALAVLHHHEHYDGGGYPGGLSGDDIPLEARIICVADSFSAMTAERPYRRRVSLDDACAELERCSGSQFDPEVVRVFTEEVRCRPATPDDSLADAMAGAMGDPEIQQHRNGHEPVLGYDTQVVTDNLTLLYTHPYFHEAADRQARDAIDDSEPFSVLIAELSELSDMNKTQGYAAGNLALQAAARAVATVAIRVGGTACRYSGAALGLIAPGTGEESVEAMAREISESLDGRPAVRVLVASWRPGESGEEVIARALSSPSVTTAPAPVAPPPV